MPIYWFYFQALALSLLLLCTTSNALNIKYCSSLNTGSSNAATYSIYQSNGLCFDNCKSQYAFAIVQGSNCWCSDSAPGDTTSTSDCNQTCPGFPSENCGSTSSGLFGYLALNKPPSGTQGVSSSTATTSTREEQTVSTQHSIGSSPATVFLPASIQVSTVFVQFSSSTSLPSSSTSVFSTTTSSSASSSLTSSSQALPTSLAPVTVLQTVTAVATASVEISIISLTPSSASSAPTRLETTTEPSLKSATTVATITSTPSPVTITTESSTTAPATTSWTPSPFASIITLTGNVQTITITPTAPPAASATIQAVAPAHQSFLSDTGRAAGVFTGVALAVVLIAAFGIWFCHRRRRNTTGTEPESGNRASRRSRMSGLSFAVKRRSGDWAGLTPLTTQGLAGGTANEKSPGDTISPASRRTSYPMRIVDQRLDPGAWYPNGSHTSLASFRDDYDYSRRVLHVRNPDHGSS